MQPCVSAPVNFVVLLDPGSRRLTCLQWLSIAPTAIPASSLLLLRATSSPPLFWNLSVLHVASCSILRPLATELSIAAHLPARRFFRASRAASSLPAALSVLPRRSGRNCYASLLIQEEMDRQSSRSAFLGTQGSRGRVNSSDGQGYQRPQASVANGGSGLSRGHLHMNLSEAFTNGSSSSSSQPHPFGTSVRSPLASPASASFFSTTLQQAPPTPTHTTHPRSNTLSNFASSSSLARDYGSPAQQPQSDFPGAPRGNSSGRTNRVSAFPPELLPSEPFPQSPSAVAPLHSPFDAPEGFGPPKRSATAGASLWGGSAIGPSSPGQLAPRTRDIWKQPSRETSSFFGELQTPSRQNSGNSESSLWLNDTSDVSLAEGLTIACAPC